MGRHVIIIIIITINVPLHLLHKHHSGRVFQTANLKQRPWQTMQRKILWPLKIDRYLVSNAQSTMTTHDKTQRY